MHESSPPDTIAQGRGSDAASAATPDDEAYAKALREAGLAPDLIGAELVRAASVARSGPPLSRRIDIVAAYYEAGGDEALSQTRRGVDRFLCQRASDGVGTTALLDHLGALAPELGEISLERIGGAEGQLVLRCGEHFSALLDDYEETLDTGDVDLRDVDAIRSGQAVTLRGIVRALNGLFERFGVRERMVPLRSDAEREIYVAVPLTEALELTKQGHLEDDDAEHVLELGCW